jgi:protocatechuate 3,4-dioxygenase beta subunit
VLTTQLYFPDEPRNREDDFFHPELVMQVAASDDALRARFDVVLAMR